MKDAYLEMISLVERLHRQCLDVVKADLDRRGSILPLPVRLSSL